MTELNEDQFPDYLKNPDDYVTLYRGRPHFWFWRLPKTEADLKGLGMHWTTDLQIAGHFGAGWNDPDYGPRDDPEGLGRSSLSAGGHIIVAKVHKSGIIHRDTPEWKSIAQDHAIMEDDGEKEVTVRPGTPVYVTDVLPVKDFDRVASKSLKQMLPDNFDNTVTTWDETGNNPTYTHKVRFPFAKPGFGAYMYDQKTIKKGGYIKKGRGTA